MRKWKGPQIPRSLLHSMYEVHTEGGGYDKEQGGQWKPGTTVEIVFQGVVMPLNNEDLQYIDSGSYTLNAQKVYTNGHTLQVGAQFRDGFDGQIYTVTAPYIPDGGMGDYEIADVAEGVKISRLEMPSATFSFTFCSQNRTAEDGSAVNGEDEAWAVADKAISYFKHAGQDDFLALGVTVVDVGQAQDRTTLLVDEAARRVGFDVQIRYTRIDERETASIEKIKI